MPYGSQYRVCFRHGLSDAATQTELPAAGPRAVRTAASRAPQEARFRGSQGFKGPQSVRLSNLRPRQIAKRARLDRPFSNACKRPFARNFRYCTNGSVAP